MKSNVIEELSTLTTVSQTTLHALADKVNYCICNAVESTLFNRENLAEIDLGIGTLLIQIGDDEIKYKFLPSKQLADNLVKTIYDEQNPLVFELEKSLVNKLENPYKNFF